MKNWEHTLIDPKTTLLDALNVIDKAGLKIALVTDSSRRLLGTVSDGDIRRAILRNISLGANVESIMRRTPITANHGEAISVVASKAKCLGLHQIPVVDKDNIVTGMVLLDDNVSAPVRENWVIIMAGGLGTRLSELTSDKPKPMLKVGSRPLLETLIRNYKDQGFYKFYLSVNYKADQIETFFGDGSNFGIKVEYLREKQRLGTAGALSLLPNRPKFPLIVSNGDLLTNESYVQMVDGHIASNAAATMAVRPFELQVPYGVVQQRKNRIVSITEKPILPFNISAGMYVLSPQVMDYIPSDKYFDMPSLFELLIKEGLYTRCHNVEGYWLDIGYLEDYKKANIDFWKVFK